MQKDKKIDIDESLYSRQLYVIGREAMEKMMDSKILVIGLDGLGQEIVKNLCLTGVSHISIHDSRIITEYDLATGFYFSRSSIGKPRDEMVIEKFKRLNEYVTLNLQNDLDNFEEFDLVIISNEPYYEQIKFNKISRRDEAKFISCQTRGVFSQIFCDFGPDFMVIDQNGENPVSGMINDISSSGVLTVVDGQKHNLEDNDVIKIMQLKDYEGVFFRVKSINPTSVQLFKTNGVSYHSDSDDNENNYEFKEAYGGDFEQLKRPRMMHFKDLEDSLRSPQIVSYNFEADEKNKVVHSCFIYLSDFIKKNGRNPADYEFLDFYGQANNGLKEHEFIIKEFARQNMGTIMPLCSFVGGFVAQEALKAISCKFTPLMQFLFYDALEIVPKNINDDFDFTKFGRYGPIAQIFGVEAFKKLLDSKVFLVGSGAIGCEHLKNLIMTGICSDGELHVTDMDSIEQSNLNRQFLFGKSDVSKMKAEVASREIRKLNEDFSYGYYKQENTQEEDSTASEGSSFVQTFKKTQMFPIRKYRKNILYYNLKVGVETEEVFSDDFFNNIDLVANALDNVEARLYIDSRCLLNRKPFVDAGTSGTKGNVQVVVPFFSENYGNSRDPPEKSIPLCTIKNFPHAIEHTIEWALSEFRFRFHDQILSIKEYLLNPTHKNDPEETDVPEDEVSRKINELNKESIEDVVNNAPKKTQDCIRNAISLFTKYFNISINSLLTTFPPDSKTKEGQPFWMPPKRAPIPINFNPSNDIHIKFIQSTANIYCYNFGFNKVFSFDEVRNYINNELLDDSNYAPQVEYKDEPVDPQKLRVAEFEKDDENNFHVDFIYACASLRASNYKIKNISRLEVKGIAGRIIPAIATTTSVISGLAVIEMIKMILKTENSFYKNTFLNLALPFFAQTDPVEASKSHYFMKDKEVEFTVWDKVEFKDTTLKNLLKAINIQFGFEISMVSIDSKLIYWDCNLKYAQNLDKKISDLAPRTPGKKYIELNVMPIDDRPFPDVLVIYDNYY